VVRQGYVARIRMAVNKEGKILGIKNTFYFDTGISAEYGANPVRSAGYTSTGATTYLMFGLIAMRFIPINLWWSL